MFDLGKPRHRSAVLVAAIALALSGCTGRGGPAAPVGSQPEVSPEWISCDVAAPDQSQGPYYAGDALDLPALGDGFTPEAAVLCGIRFEPRDDGGEDEVATEESAGEIGPLLEALRLPDLPAPETCDAVDGPDEEDGGDPAPWVALLDGQGRWIRPGLPEDGCGQVRPEVLDGVESVEWTPVSVFVLSEVASPGAPISGCPPQQTDTVRATTTADPGRDWPVPATGLPFTADDLRLCVYRVAEDQLGSGEPVGTFERGGVLTSQHRSAIAETLGDQVRSAGPVAACAEQARRFAVLSNADGSPGEVHIELDGCQRALIVRASGESDLATAGSALVDLIEHPVGQSEPADTELDG